MLGVGFMGFAFVAGLLGAIVGGIYEGVTMGVGPINTLLQFQILREEQVDFLFISFTFPTFNTAWFAALFDVLTWNTALWTGWANYLRAPLLLGITFAFAAGLLITLMSAVLSRR